MMNLQLLCDVGAPFLGDILTACRPFLAEEPEPVVAYLPAASTEPLFKVITEAAFQGLAEVVSIDLENDDLAAVERALERASLLYIPGGNTYLLSHRVHRSGAYEVIRSRVRAGLPLVAFSAGTIFCGQDILTTYDINGCGSTTFEGLGLVPYNFSVHYPVDDLEAQKAWDDRLAEYHAFFNTPILALEDGAAVQVIGEQIELLEGGCWLLKKGEAKRKVAAGPIPGTEAAG